MRIRWLVATLGVSCLAIVGCSGGSSGPTPSPTATTPAKSPTGTAIGDKLDVAGLAATYHGTKDVRGARSVYIEMEDNYFAPTVLRGRPGQRLLVKVENESQSPHTFTTADGQVDMELQPGMVAEARVTLPRSGNLSFFCKLQKANGMAGGFTVSGPLDAPGKTITPYDR